MTSQTKHPLTSNNADALTDFRLPPPPIPGGPPVSVPIALIAAWKEAHGLILLDGGHRHNTFPPILVVAPKTPTTKGN